MCCPCLRSLLLTPPIAQECDCVKKRVERAPLPCVPPLSTSSRVPRHRRPATHAAAASTVARSVPGNDAAAAFVASLTASSAALTPPTAPSSSIWRVTDETFSRIRIRAVDGDRDRKLQVELVHVTDDPELGSLIACEGDCNVDVDCQVCFVAK